MRADGHRADQLDVYLRAYAEPIAEESEKGDGGSDRPRNKPGWTPVPGEREVLVFDCETTTDTAQELTFGVWRLCREILDADRDNAFVRLAVREEGIFFSDDLPLRDPDGFALLKRYAENNRPALDPERHWVEPVMECAQEIVLMSRSSFVEERLFKIAYKRKAPVVGFNLPFDLSRISLGWYPPRAKGWRGGFALYTHTYHDGEREHKNPYRPRIYVKPIDGHRALISFSSRHGEDPADRDARGNHYRGEFVDLHAFVLGLTGEKHSLLSAGRRMGAKVLKGEGANEHGKITHTYIGYARRDVAATASLYERCRLELDRHPIEIEPHHVLSSAGPGKGYLKAAGVRPRLELQPDFSREVLGAAASSYYGGRVEAPILGMVPIRYYDVMSMYPTVNVLMDLWELVIAEEVVVREATAEVRELLERLSAEELLEPTAWPALRGIAQLDEIDAASCPVLPVRSNYGRGGDPKIGVNQLSEPHSGWYAIPDLVASKVLTGHPPRIKRALMFEAKGCQQMRPIAFRGDVEIDPAQRDFFAALIEERQKLKLKDTLTPEDEWLSQSLKIIANSTSYGINMEMLRDEAPTSKPAAIAVHTGAGSFDTATTTLEEPRHYCFPPIATLITAGARLVLALVEHQVSEAGGRIAYMDTDSVAVISTETGGPVACPGGPEGPEKGEQGLHALSWREADQIAESFAVINPYSGAAGGRSILELESENKSAEEGADPQLYIFALGSKRYAMFNLGPDGAVTVRKYSEHGLGMRLDPTDTAAPVAVAEDEEGVLEAAPRRGSGRGWIEEWWRYLIERYALERDLDEPKWFGLPALCKLPITRPDLAQRLNLAPFNFCMAAQVTAFPGVALQEGESLRLLAPFDPDSNHWTRMSWTDAYTGKRYRIASADPGENPSPGVVRVKSYADIAAEFVARPESKFQTPGDDPCPPRYRGPLVRRMVVPGEEINQGKEGNQLEDIEAGLLTAEEATNRYVDPATRDARFDRWVRPVVCAFSVATVARETGISERTIKRVRAGENPTRTHRAVLTDWAVGKAAQALRMQGQPVGVGEGARSTLQRWTRLDRYFSEPDS